MTKGKAVIFLNIDGMDCKSCATGIEGSLLSVNGVYNAKVRFEKGIAEIQYDPEKVEPNIFINKIKENGFASTIIKGKEKIK